MVKIWLKRSKRNAKTTKQRLFKQRRINIKAKCLFLLQLALPINKTELSKVMQSILIKE